MNRRELTRLAVLPGPLQKLAQQALQDEYDTDYRVQLQEARRAQPFDDQRYFDAYTEAALPKYSRMVPSGDRSIGDSQRYTAQQEAANDLMSLYESWNDKPWYEDIADYATPENLMSGAHSILESVTPGYSQVDSMKWAEENLDKYLQLRETDPLTATGYLPAALLGTFGMMPGASSMIGAGRKLSKAQQMMIESLF